MIKVYFLDIDDCLIKTSALTVHHLATVKKELYKFGLKKAADITQEFAASFRRLYDKHQGKRLTSKDKRLLDNYIKRLAELEKPVLETYGEVKRWSREVCLYIAGEKFGLKLSNDILIKTADSLWKKITEYAVYYPDTKKFLENLIHEKIPIYLITSSDSRLVKEDKTELFHYDPDYSRNLKLKRLQKFIDLGIPQNHIFIGDPTDKPKTWVFEEALKLANKEYKQPFESIMVGDSYNNDLVPAGKMGMDKLVLINRHKEKTATTDNKVLIIKSLLSLQGVPLRG